MLLSRHPCVSIYDVRHIVNVHEARVQLFRPQQLQHAQTFNIHIDRKVGTFHVHANGQRVALPIPATSWASWCVGHCFDVNETDVLLDLDLECLQLTTKPGFATAALSMREPEAFPIGVLCLSRDNVDGGLLVATCQVQNAQKVQKELSPGYAAIVMDPCSLKDIHWTPIRSFDGHGDAIMNVLVMKYRNRNSNGRG